MANEKKGEVTIRGRFESGEKVYLVPGGDEFRGASKDDAVKTATTTKAGETSFSGLVAGHRFFAVAFDGDQPVRWALVTAKEPVSDARAAAAQPLPSAAPGHNTSHVVHTGARGTAQAAVVRGEEVEKAPVTDTTAEPIGAGGAATVEGNAIEGVRVFDPAVGQPTPKSAQVLNPSPAPRQEDAKGPQMSDTLTGEATPIDPKAADMLPHPSQEQLRDGEVPGVSKTAPQASATPLGEATPIEPVLAQQDVPKGVAQASATPEGEATVQPVQPPKRGAAKRETAAKTRKGAPKGGARKGAARKTPAGAGKKSGGSRRAAGQKRERTEK